MDRKEAAEGLAISALIVLGGCIRKARRPKAAKVRPPVREEVRKLGVGKKGRSIKEKVRAAVEAIGGIKRFVKPGSRVVLKPNAAFARSPEVGANTHPEVVEAVAELCYKAGAKEVMIFEHTVDPAAVAFKLSGMEAMAQRARIRLISADNRRFYRKVRIPEGKRIREDEIVAEVLEADVLINLPVCKAHSAAGVSLGMKNLMGLIWNRGRYHALGLHQCIADLSTVLRPALIVLDATRCLLTNAPKGPGKVIKPGLVVAGTDPVGVDAYGCRILGRRPENVGHVRMAHEMGLGEIDLSKFEVVEV